MENFTQVVVWPGTVIQESEIADFEAFMMEEFGTRVKYIETIVTKPDFGDTDKDAGGRHDVLFYIHSEDIPKFAIPRFSIGARWIEDVLDNEIRINEENGTPKEYSIYPDHVKAYRTW